MSRAFVKESDGDAIDELPDRPISPHRNLVTPRGLALIEAEVKRLHRELDAARLADDKPGLARLGRDLRYWSARQASAEPVPALQQAGTVRFGVTVTLDYADGTSKTFQIVGQDESDPANGLLSYMSPLALALNGKAIGDMVTTAQGDAEIVALNCGKKDT